MASQSFISFFTRVFHFSWAIYSLEHAISIHQIQGWTLWYVMEMDYSCVHCSWSNDGKRTFFPTTTKKRWEGRARKQNVVRACYCPSVQKPPVHPTWLALVRICPQHFYGKIPHQSHQRYAFSIYVVSCLCIILYIYIDIIIILINYYTLLFLFHLGCVCGPPAGSEAMFGVPLSRDAEIFMCFMTWGRFETDSSTYHTSTSCDCPNR